MHSPAKDGSEFATLRNSRRTYCSLFQSHSQTSSIVCQISNLKAGVEYKIGLYSADLGEIDTQTSVQIGMHSQEQLDFRIEPQKLIIFKNDSHIDASSLPALNFNLTLLNPNRLVLASQLNATGNVADNLISSFSHCNLEGIESLVSNHKIRKFIDDVSF